eukprot:jgi/Psemu1/4980/gm1.4980_g
MGKPDKVKEPAISPGGQNSTALVLTDGGQTRKIGVNVHCPTASYEALTTNKVVRRLPIFDTNNPQKEQADSSIRQGSTNGRSSADYQQIRARYNKQGVDPILLSDIYKPQKEGADSSKYQQDTAYFGDLDRGQMNNNNNNNNNTAANPQRELKDHLMLPIKYQEDMANFGDLDWGPKTTKMLLKKTPLSGLYDHLPPPIQYPAILYYQISTNHKKKGLIPPDIKEILPILMIWQWVSHEAKETPKSPIFIPIDRDLSPQGYLHNQAQKKLHAYQRSNKQTVKTSDIPALVFGYKESASLQLQSAFEKGFALAVNRACWAKIGIAPFTRKCLGGDRNVAHELMTLANGMIDVDADPKTDQHIVYERIWRKGDINTMKETKTCTLAYTKNKEAAEPIMEQCDGNFMDFPVLQLRKVFEWKLQEKNTKLKKDGMVGALMEAKDDPPVGALEWTEVDEAELKRLIEEDIQIKHTELGKALAKDLIQLVSMATTISEQRMEISREYLSPTDCEKLQIFLVPGVSSPGVSSKSCNQPSGDVCWSITRLLSLTHANGGQVE